MICPISIALLARIDEKPADIGQRVRHYIVTAAGFSEEIVVFRCHSPYEESIYTRIRYPSQTRAAMRGSLAIFAPPAGTRGVIAT